MSSSEAHLGGNPQVLALVAALAPGGTDLLFIAVDTRVVDVAVAGVERDLDRLADLAAACLPDTECDLGLEADVDELPASASL